jgi:hypothetical protein
MILRDVVERFEQEAPITVMTRILLEHTFAPQRVDAIFRDVDHPQAEGTLLFSTVAEMMGLVAARIRKSVHAAYQARVEEISVTVKAVYDKLQRVKGDVSQALVRRTATEMAGIIEDMRATLPKLLPGYRVKILDGNHLRRTQRRLGVLRHRNVAPLPGHAAVVLDPRLKLMIDLFPCEDAHAQERTLLPAILETIERKDLWIADRNFCTTDFLWGIAERLGFFVIREHGSSLRSELVGKRFRVGRCDTGTVYEQAMRIFDAQGRPLEIRRVTIELDQATRDGDAAIHIVTNLPAKVSAIVVGDLYRKRWNIETGFAEVAKNLEGEVETLGYPKAALFAFSMALIVHNVLSVAQAALRAAHGTDAVEDGISMYYLADEAAHTYRGLTIAIPAAYWMKTYRRLSRPALARELVRIAQGVKLARYRKHPRTSQKRSKPMTKKGRGHASTARLLNTS